MKMKDAGHQDNVALGQPQWSEADKKLHSKETKLFQVLLLNPYFQEDVKKFRRIHQIPQKGFKDAKDYFHWAKHCQDAKEELKITEEVVTLDKNDKPRKLQQREYKSEISNYYVDLCKILARYNLSLEWISFVDDYICSGRNRKINPYEVYITRRRLDNGLILHEEATFKFGATMKIDFLTRKFLGQSAWKNSIEPLQRLMQGYQEKGKRPSKDKTELKVRIFKETQAGAKDQKIYDKFPSSKVENIWAVRKLRQRYKKQITPNA